MITGSATMTWTQANDSEQVRAELERWVPKMFWVDFNEVFGCLGQMAANKELQTRLRVFLSRMKFTRIAHQVGSLLDSYSKSNKRSTVRSSSITKKKVKK